MLFFRVFNIVSEVKGNFYLHAIKKDESTLSSFVEWLRPQPCQREPTSLVAVEVK